MTPGSFERMAREANAVWAQRLAQQAVLQVGRSPGIYWERTGSREHRVTFVREQEPAMFRGIPVVVRP